MQIALYIGGASDIIKSNIQSISLAFYVRMPKDSSTLEHRAVPAAAEVEF